MGGGLSAPIVGTPRVTTGTATADSGAGAIPLGEGPFDGTASADSTATGVICGRAYLSFSTDVDSTAIAVGIPGVAEPPVVEPPAAEPTPVATGGGSGVGAAAWRSHYESKKKKRKPRDELIEELNNTLLELRMRLTPDSPKYAKLEETRTKLRAELATLREIVLGDMFHDLPPSIQHTDPELQALQKQKDLAESDLKAEAIFRKLEAQLTLVRGILREIDDEDAILLTIH